jgi:hypothetical protein
MNIKVALQILFVNMYYTLNERKHTTYCKLTILNISRLFCIVETDYGRIIHFAE